MSLTQRRNALRHLKECQTAADKFLEAMKDPPVGGKIVTSYEKQIARLERDYFSLAQSADVKDSKTMLVLKELQNAIVKNQVLYQQGKEDPIIERQKILELSRNLNDQQKFPMTSGDDYKKKQILQNELQEKAFGQSLESQNKQVTDYRTGILSLNEKIEKLPTDDPQRKILGKLMDKAVKQYGDAKAQLFVNQLEVSGKGNPGDRKEYIDKRIKSLNTNPVFETDPLAKKMMEAECKALPGINKDKFIDNIKTAVRFDQITQQMAADFNEPDAFKKYIEDRLPKDKGYKVEVIPSKNNILLKVSDGENTVILKRGEVAGKLTEMGCDYKEALKVLPDKSGFAKVHDLVGVENKAHGNHMMVYFEMSEFVKGENLGSYFKNMPSGTETEMLEKQSKALKETSTIIDNLDKFRKNGVVVLDIKCGNILKDTTDVEETQKIGDFKSMIKIGDLPDSAIPTNDCPVTFMTKNCVKEIKENGKIKRHYDINELTKTAIGATMMEMLTLSDDPNTSPYVTFGLIKLDPNQPILEKGLGKEMFDLYSKMVNDPKFTLAEAKEQMAEIQKKIDLQLETKLQETTKLTQKEVNDVSLKIDEVETEMKLTGKTPETEKQVIAINNVLGNIPKQEEDKMTEKSSKFESLLNKWKGIEKFGTDEVKDDTKKVPPKFSSENFRERIATQKLEDEEKKNSTDLNLPKGPEVA